MIFLVRHYNIIKSLIFYNSIWLNLTKNLPPAIIYKAVGMILCGKL